MARRLENPMAPPGYTCELPNLQLYIPLDPWIQKSVKDDNPESLFHLVDPTLLFTPPDSEEETRVKEEIIEKPKETEVQENPIALKNSEDSLYAFIAGVKNLTTLAEKEKKSKRHSKKRSKHHKRSEKSSRSQSPNPRTSPERSTSLNKPRLSKRRTSLRHKSPSRQEYSSSRRLSTRTPSPSPSPARSPSPQRYRLSFRSKPKSNKSSIRTPSPNSTRSPSPQLYSHGSRSRYSSSHKASIHTPSRSPSPNRSSSPRRGSRSRHHHYSSHRETYTRTPSRSPSLDRSSVRKKLPSYGRSSRHHSSRSNKSPSYQSSPSPCRSPERTSRRYKSYGKSCVSPSRRSPPSPQRSPSHHGSPIRTDQSLKHPKSPSDEKSKDSKSPRNKSPVRQRKFPIEDEYSRLLAKEMQKRQIWDGSDLELEDGEVDEEKSETDADTRIPVKEDISQNEQKLMKEELEIVKDDELQSNPSLPKPKIIKQEIKSESLDQKGFMLQSFYCKYCQLSLNSEVTWQSHINGKKHAKVLKLQTVHEVAKGSIAVPSTSEFVSEDTPRFGKPALGKKRLPIRDIPKIQPAIDEIQNAPVLGLQSVCEIRSDKEISYYCELCDAPCSSHSILPHLIGFKHQLRFLREIDPDCYERNKLRSKKDFDYRLRDILFRHERKFGRGQMQVFQELDDFETKPKVEAYSYPGTSWRNIPPEESNAEDIPDIPSNDACLDTSKSDFFCKLCDAHMNNMNMWESHVRGKRHLRNAKKIPGENISKVRSVKAEPHVASKLKKLLREQAADEIIVGLDSIRETHGPNGEIYTCFPCGSNCTNLDIIDHLLLTKHKIRYLEKLVTDGKPNGISEISQIEIHDEYFRIGLIDDECYKMMQKYGSGNVEVYVAKK